MSVPAAALVGMSVITDPDFTLASTTVVVAAAPQVNVPNVGRLLRLRVAAVRLSIAALIRSAERSTCSSAIRATPDRRIRGRREPQPVSHPRDNSAGCRYPGS